MISSASIQIKECDGRFVEGLKLKDGSVKAPDVYLGAEVKQFRIPESDDREDQVGHVFIQSGEGLSRTSRQSWKMWDWGCQKRTTTPLSQGYRPELDQTAGVGCAATKLLPRSGRREVDLRTRAVDILMPVSLMSRYLVSARRSSSAIVPCVYI
ncbi:hypothetical protein MHU86_23265 [Fragilaria crotonensis]|nr:hypothetical protein MHU86_23265 [Fragilaria crotonensis]